MKNLLQKDKKGVSIMVGYVLLIVIAVSLSILVFGYLKLYVPKDVPECASDIRLIIDDVSCVFSSKQIDITLSNRGLFSVDSAQIKMGELGRLHKEETLKSVAFDFGFAGGNALAPGEVWGSIIPIDEITIISGNSYEVEIEPVMDIDGEIVFCEKSVISTVVAC